MIIRVKLNEKKRIYRDICVDPHVNLYTLASYAVDAFGFDFDHCFGFFQSPDIYRKGRDMDHYELFYDINQEVDENTKSVVKTAVSDIFKANKDKWWMLFDYGDDWVFEMECLDIDNEGQFKSGTVTKVSGVAPEQYGPDSEIE